MRPRFRFEDCFVPVSVCELDLEVSYATTNVSDGPHTVRESVTRIWEFQNQRSCDSRAAIQGGSPYPFRSGLILMRGW